MANGKRTKKAVEEILSKFSEPRGVGRMEYPGGPTTIYTPGQKLPVTASTPQDAALAQRAMFGTPAQQNAVTEAVAKAAARDPRIQKEAEKNLKEIAEQKRLQAKEDLERLRAENPGSITPTDPTGEGSSFVGKALDAASLPQRKALNALARVLGKEVSDADSETASQGIVEAAAERLGLPEDSAAANAAKALGVAGLEVFADPLGPLSKGAKALKAAAKAPGVSKLLRLGDANMLEKIIRDRRLRELAEVLRPRPGSRSTAAELARKGAEVVKPVGKIIRSRE